MKKLLVIILQSLFITSLIGQHISQWRGAERNGNYEESNLLRQWPAEGPELLWYSEEIGTGHSSASVTGERVYVTGREGDLEYLTSFNLEGIQLWKVPFGKGWHGSFPDSRSTPNVVDTRVYVVSGMAEVVCLDAQTGDIMWAVDALKEFEGACTMWGFCESPLVIDDKVIFTPGGMQTHMVALNRDNGETVWR